MLELRIPLDGMAAQGIYVGESESWLVEYKQQLLAYIRDAASGRVASISGATKSLSRLHMTPDQLNQELLEVKYALTRLNPVKYPREPNLIVTDFSGC